MRCRMLLVTAGACSAVLYAADLRAQSSTSAPLAATLTSLLDKAATSAFAASDPKAAGRFVAASYIPAGQLLVVSAHHPSVDAIAQRIADGQYRDVYLDLQATPTPMGKFFVQDTRANGLLHPTVGAVDIVYQDGVRTIAFNDDPLPQGLTDAEYDAQFGIADDRYTHMLRVLIDALQAHRRASDTG